MYVPNLSFVCYLGVRLESVTYWGTGCAAYAAGCAAYAAGCEAFAAGCAAYATSSENSANSGLAWLVPGSKFSNYDIDENSF